MIPMSFEVTCRFVCDKCGTSIAGEETRVAGLHRALEQARFRFDKDRWKRIKGPSYASDKHLCPACAISG